MSRTTPDAAVSHSPVIAAATIVMVRDAPSGPQVLMLRRHESMSAFGGLWVFPGGKVESADRAHARALGILTDALHAPDLFAGTPAAPASPASRIAAIRETFEETGLLYVGEADPAFAPRYARHREDWRVAVARDASAFEALLSTEKARPDVDALHYWMRMVPPQDVPRRFDTDFFLARAPADQEPIADRQESMDVRWVAMEDADAPDIACAPVTRIVLLELRLRVEQFGSLEAFLNATRQEPCRLLYTRRGQLDGGMYAVFPWDPHYADVAGDGALWSEEACAQMQGLPGRLPIQDGLFSTK